jgi:hypothetical protein
MLKLFSKCRRGSATESIFDVYIREIYDEGFSIISYYLITAAQFIVEGGTLYNTSGLAHSFYS